MSSRRKKEGVFVSFHYLVQVSKNDADEDVEVPFTEDDFEAFCKKIAERPTYDFNQKDTLEKLRDGSDIPLESPSRLDQRTLFGVFKAPYTGHSYDNSAKGKIPADSVSLRRFHYIVYLSKSGRIYLGAQYLGQFGGYSPLSKTLMRLFPKPSLIHSRTFRVGFAGIENAKPKKVTVQFARKPDSISSNNIFKNGGMFAFEKGEDKEFEKKVSNQLLSLVGSPHEKVRKKVAKLLSENDMFDVDDEDITNCTILADIDGRKKTIYLFDQGHFATKFPVEMSLNKDGHPDYEVLKGKMLDLLKKEVISRKENV